MARSCTIGCRPCRVLRDGNASVSRNCDRTASHGRSFDMALLHPVGTRNPLLSISCSLTLRCSQIFASKQAVSSSCTLASCERLIAPQAPPRRFGVISHCHVLGRAAPFSQQELAPTPASLCKHPPHLRLAPRPLRRRSPRMYSTWQRAQNVTSFATSCIMALLLAISVVSWMTVPQVEMGTLEVAKLDVWVPA